MTKLFKFITLVAASSLAFLGSARAQLVTYETLSTWSGSVSAFSKAGNTASIRAETLKEMYAISSVTFRFFTTNPNSSAAANLSAKFGEWDTGTNTLLAGTITDFGTVNVAAPLTWSAGTMPNIEGTIKFIDKSLTFGSLYVTDPYKTYAFVLQNLGASNSAIGLGLNDNNVFNFGQSFNGSSLAVEDFTFAQIVMVPVPEASTTAAIAGCALVGALATLRRRQKMKLVAA